MTRTLKGLLVILLASLGGVGEAEGAASEVARAAPSPSLMAKVAPELRAELQDGDGGMVSAIVIFRAQADLSAALGASRAARLRSVVRALRHAAEGAQRPLRALVAARRAQGNVARARWLWVVNGLALRATKNVIRELAARPEVLSVREDATIQAPVTVSTAAAAEPNVALVNAPALWALGFRGQGVVVASMDTGVDVSHPDLSAQWRGGTNSWFDPNGEHPTEPTDVNGHGTWTTGVMVGREAGGTAIGVAPDAAWIAVKIFNDHGVATVSGIHQGFQWLLDPDGDPGTPDAPNVVNNSWSFGSPGCDLEFQLDLRSLRAAGILPVFAAGNFGPGTATSTSPANNPEAFAVGATDNADSLYASSSRGPSACGEPETVFPELAGPGVDIRTTDLFGLYTRQTGTSLAPPHVAGAIALLLSAFGGLTSDQQESVLEEGSVDLGGPGPDNDFGHGRLDVLAAYGSAGAATNQAPAVDAGPDQSMTLPAGASLDGTVADDGRPSGFLSTLWSAQGGPGTVTFENAAAVDTTAAFSTPGVYVLRLTADDGALSTFDEVTVTVARADLIFADGFESGDLSAWSAKVDAEDDLRASPTAALVGAQGMVALIDDRTAMYLRDDSPAGEIGYRARFHFDPNGIGMVSGQAHPIMVARNSAVDVLRVELRRSKAGYQVGASVRADSGGYSKTSWFPVTDAPHPIEIVWSAASGARTKDGSLSLFVDGAAKQTLSHIDNDALRVEEARLGPLGGIDAGTLGAEFFDDFVSRRVTPIGP